MCAQLYVFFRSADYLKFLMGLGKLFTKKCAQLHVLFAVETILSFWGELESFDKKGVTSYIFFSQYRLSQVFDGTWKNFHKKVCPVTRFVRCGDYLKFWMGLRKVSTKMCAQLHVLFAVETILSFGWHFEKFPQVCVPSYTFFFAVQTISSFWWDLENFSQKSVPSYTFCSLWGLSQVFDGFWKNFHKKVCPVTRFVRCGDYLKFWMGLRKVSTKMCAQLHVLFAVETILSFGWDLENYRQKSVPSYTFCSLWRLSQVLDGT